MTVRNVCWGPFPSFNTLYNDIFLLFCRLTFVSIYQMYTVHDDFVVWVTPGRPNDKLPL